MKTAGEVPEPRRGRDAAAALGPQRERAVAILTEAFVSNLIEVEEFERRVAAANGARSLRELGELIEDLPALPAPAAASASPAAALALRDEEQPLWGIMMSHRYRGSHWLKSRHVGIRTLMSSLELDFRQLELPAQTIEIDVACLMSTVVLTVPEDLPVEVEVVPLMGNVRESNRVRSGRGGRAAGEPLLRVTGFAVMSEIRVRTR